MTLHDAFVQGNKVRLPEWTGYWYKDENDNVMVYTRTGDVLDTPDYVRYGDRTDWEPVITKGLGFDFAILALKAGKKLQRTGWDDKGMFIIKQGDYAVPKDKLRPGPQHISAEFLEAEGVNEMYILPHVDMWTADNKYVSGWLASQTDMFATDWVVIP